MHIKDIQKTTLIDFPGIIASTIFVGGCNFNCAYCYNRVLLNLQTKSDIPMKKILDIVMERKKYIEGVVITGGEPTIQRGLIEFISQIKDMGLKVKLDSNGYRPDVLEKLIQSQLVDYIALDIKAPISKYSQVSGITIDANLILESIQLLTHSPILHEFRSTIWQEAFTEADLLEMMDLIKMDYRAPYYLQNYYPTDPNINPLFTPFTKKQIFAFLEKAQGVYPRVQLRGNFF